ncbi:60S ribosomal export protein NMD3 [Ischnura elegans]|uniref:60S ribosomal export protein NMD3 n=1 Tax=Ischnura elegans TaxID=197161 RepID=UPI001ED8B93F|nr:60S ribosomal export protein NMD3 [Ischnura elegans]XP_046396884.1 60S ribosomal export protein NMD3 [Ischnura elegans]
MEYVNVNNEGNQSRILCCQCGTVIEPNPANMCVACLRTEVDITAGIPKQGTLYFCRGCERYLQPPSEWVSCSLESRELLSLCLKKLKGLNRVKLVDAGFVWTEPHSKRIKVRLTVHGEVLGGAILQQVFIVEFTVNHQMCDDCHRTEAKDFWKALVQVRQKSDNKKTFFYLEQLILKHRAHEHTLGIKPIHEGLDFFYATESTARKMVDFLTAVLPCRYQHSKKLISHDIHSNIYNYKFTYSVEIVPVSKDSLVCLEKSTRQHLAGIGPLCLVYRVTNTLHLIDPSTGQIAEVNGQTFWRQPFRSICDPKQLCQYIVMDIDPIRDADRKQFPGQGAISLKHMLADAWVIKASELGATDSSTIHTRTHLGHILRPGDTVLGYALAESNVNNDQFEKLQSQGALPDVVLVKKLYGDDGRRRRNRAWKLKHLAEDDMQLDTEQRDYQEFLEDLEEDPGYRQNVNIYKARKAPCAVDVNDPDEDETMPKITLEEMLDDLDIGDDMDGENVPMQ